jgi:DivIVA domain-containing protein
VTLTPDEVRDVVFSAPPPGHRGYNADAVDDFLDRIEATLRGRDTLTAQDVHDVRFRKPPAGEPGYFDAEVDAFLNMAADVLSGFGAGYDIAEVDAFIDRVISTLHGQDTLTVEEVRNVKFATAAVGVDGYDEEGVDSFLLVMAMALGKLATTPRRLTADDVSGIGFHGARLDQFGYDEAEVDSFLDHIEAGLRGRVRLTAQQVRDVTFGESPTEGQGYDQDEVDSFLDLVEEQLSVPVSTRSEAGLGRWRSARRHQVFVSPSASSGPAGDQAPPHGATEHGLESRPSDARRR